MEPAPLPPARPPVFLAVDTADRNRARRWARTVGPYVGGLKVGLEFFCAHGPSGVRQLKRVDGSLPLFLDLKLHDISNTVGGAVKSLAPLAPDFLTLHASGTAGMLRAARQARDEAGMPTRLLGVTVLTCLDEAALQSVGQATPVRDQVLRLADVALEAGLDGLVCSPLEVGMLRERCGPAFTLFTPGIRPEGGPAQDQKRLATPRAALEAGATFLVIGRPITEARSPARAALSIANSLRHTTPS